MNNGETMYKNEIKTIKKIIKRTNLRIALDFQKARFFERKDTELPHLPVLHVGQVHVGSTVELQPY